MSKSNVILEWAIVMAIVIVCFASVMARCQSSTEPAPALSVTVGDTRPRLELEPRLNLNGGGFQEVSGSMTGGFGMEREHFGWHVSGTYDAAKKKTYFTPDGDVINPHGNIRSIGGQVCGRTTGGWLFCGSASYASLRTTNYDKVGRGVGLGVGYDFKHLRCPNCNDRGPHTARLILTYGVPVTCNSFSLHCAIAAVDVEQGVKADWYVPGPLEPDWHGWKRPIFHVMAYAGIIKTSEHGAYTHDASASMGLMWRF